VDEVRFCGCEGFDEEWVELSRGVALEPPEGVEIGLGAAGAFLDVGLERGSETRRFTAIRCSAELA
jgi:hypothetical protein